VQKGGKYGKKRGVYGKARQGPYCKNLLEGFLQIKKKDITARPSVARRKRRRPGQSSGGE